MAEHRWQERFALTGKTALVTGASKGIGAEICAVLADAGADIAAVARDRAGLESVAATVRGLGRRCEIFLADMASPDEPVAAAEAALAAFGAIDILVNNAGVALLDRIVDQSVADWDTTMAVNLRAPFLFAKTLAPQMIARGRGKIVNISSVAGTGALDAHAAYSASKAGLNALTRGMTIEWARHNIQANAVCPTVILTPMGRMVWGDPAKGEPMRAKIPLGRFGEPVEVADMVLYLASPASDMVNGQAFHIDGGFTAQ